MTALPDLPRIIRTDAEPDTDTDTDTETEGWSVCKVTHDTATSRFGVDSTFPILFL
jgi:hypothetical protein